MAGPGPGCRVAQGSRFYSRGASPGSSLSRESRGTIPPERKRSLTKRTLPRTNLLETPGRRGMTMKETRLPAGRGSWKRAHPDGSGPDGTYRLLSVPLSGGARAARSSPRRPPLHRIPPEMIIPPAPAGHLRTPPEEIAQAMEFGDGWGWTGRPVWDISRECRPPPWTGVWPGIPAPSCPPAEARGTSALSRDVAELALLRGAVSVRRNPHPGGLVGAVLRYRRADGRWPCYGPPRGKADLPFRGPWAPVLLGSPGCPPPPGAVHAVPVQTWEDLMVGFWMDHFTCSSGRGQVAYQPLADYAGHRHPPPLCVR